MLKIFSRIIFINIVLLLTLLISSNILVISSSKDKNYYSISKIPHKKIALVLGTSRFNREGYMNAFFYNRILAAYNLYLNNKVDYILVSGDGGNREPYFMKKELIKMGIKETKIVTDEKGFDTYQSILRSKNIFNESDIIIVSQKFHNQRALFIANNNNIRAIAFNSEDVKGNFHKILIREIFARVKAVYEVLFKKDKNYIINTINFIF